MKLRQIFLTVFYSGLFPKAPGTFGTFIALIFGVALLQFIDITTLFMLTALISVVAAKEIDKYEAIMGEHDSKEIVIDELAGIWLALSLCGINETNGLYMIIFCFIYFRIFDITKPSIIGRIDRDVKGGWGVMGDDLVAGVAAAVASSATYEILNRFVF